MSNNGSRDLAVLSAHLKGTPLRLPMVRGLKSAAKPMIGEVQAAARAKLPRRGGLNEQVAGQRVTISVRTGARTAGVRLLTSAPDTAMTDAGFVRHPVFGHRDRWKRQSIPNAAGWWTDTCEASAPKVKAEMLAVMETYAAAIRVGM